MMPNTKKETFSTLLVEWFEDTTFNLSNEELISKKEALDLWFKDWNSSDEATINTESRSEITFLYFEFRAYFETLILISKSNLEKELTTFKSYIELFEQFSNKLSFEQMQHALNEYLNNLKN